MLPAVPEQEGTLIGTWIAGSLAVDVGYAIVDQLDGVVSRK
jgi:hypothetical protein